MANGMTTITASKIQAADGTLLSSGTVGFLPVSGAGARISSIAAAGGPVMSREVLFTVVDGVITGKADGSGPAVLNDALASEPSIAYAVSFYDQWGARFPNPGYGTVQPTGATWSLDTYVPDQPAVASVAFITFSVGTVTTGPPGSQASATNIGTPTAVVLDLTLPSGQTGSLELGSAVSQDVRFAERLFVAGVTYLATDALSPSQRPISEYNNYGFAGGLVGPNGRPLLGASFNTSGQVISHSVYNALSTTTFLANPPAAPVLRYNYKTGSYFEEMSPGALATAQKIFLPFTGQSLSTGDEAFVNGGNTAKALTTTPAVCFRMFSTGGMRAQTLGTSGITLVPTTESTGGNVSGGAAEGETPYSGLAIALERQVLSIASGDPEEPQIFAGIIATSGKRGQVYANICGPTDYANDHINGSPSFQEMRSQVSNAVALQPGTIVPGVGIIHGEFDGTNLNNNYAANLATWQSDIQTMVKAVTGQSGTVPTVISANVVPLTSVQQFAAMLGNRGKIVMACPEYMLPHNIPPVTANLHLTAYGYRLLGEYFSQAIYRMFFNRREWFPTMPVQILEVTTTSLRYQLIVDFATPYGDPLAIDTALIAARAAFGFNFADASGARTPNAITLSGDRQITFTFASAFSATNRTIGYAQQVYANGPALTPSTVPGGNIRDTSSRLSVFPDATGALTPMYNWLVPFKLSF